MAGLPAAPPGRGTCLAVNTAEASSGCRHFWLGCTQGLVYTEARELWDFRGPATL